MALHRLTNFSPMLCLQKRSCREDEFCKRIYIVTDCRQSCSNELLEFSSMSDYYRGKSDQIFSNLNSSSIHNLVSSFNLLCVPKCTMGRPLLRM